MWALLVFVCSACSQPRFETPETLEFTDLAIGSTGTARFTVRNTTDHDDAIDLEVPEPFKVEQLSFWLRARSQVEVSVTFTATTLGPREDALIIRGRAHERSMVLRTRGIGPHLETKESLVLPPIPLLATQLAKESRGVLLVQNVGTADSRLEVTSATTSGPELCIGTFVDEVCTPAPLPTITAGDVAMLPLTLRVRSDARREWSVRLRSNDSFQAETEVRLLEPGDVITRVIRRLQPTPVAFSSGSLRLVFEGGERDIRLEPSTSTDSCVVALPSALDFGFVTAGCPSISRSVSLYNVCNTPVAVTDASVTGDFALTRFTPMQTVLVGGPPADISVRIQPTALGPRTGILRIGTTAGEQLVSLRANVDPSSRSVDVFRQGTEPQRIEALMVVDTSPSFAPQRAATRARLSNVLVSWTAICADLRVGFVAAEADADAGVQLALNDAGAAWTRSDAPDFEALVLSAFDALPPSSETEGCVGPAAAVLLDAGLPAGGNARVLCVSDALEQSPTPIASLSALRAHFGTFQWDVVTGTSSSTCSVEAHDDDLTHSSLTSAANGQRVDVCSSWSSNFVVGGFGCGYRSVFYLTSPPRGEIEVRVDGQLVPTSDWTYASADNTVRFTVPPPSNSLVEVSYDRPCSP